MVTQWVCFTLTANIIRPGKLIYHYRHELIILKISCFTFVPTCPTTGWLQAAHKPFVFVVTPCLLKSDCRSPNMASSCPPWADPLDMFGVTLLLCKYRIYNRNGYTLKEGNSVKKVFASLVYRGLLLEEKNIFSFRADLIL